MALQIGDTAPDFDAETTEGRIRFHDWLGISWGVLFSHPKDFTPVCTTELGYMARIKPEFDRRDVKIIGLSVDPVDNHARWADDIRETQGHAPNYPMIGDTDLSISKAWGMLPASTTGDASKRTPADNQTVRNVFVIGPAKKIKLILVYPMTTGHNFDEVLREALVRHLVFTRPRLLRAQSRQNVHSTSLEQGDSDRETGCGSRNSSRQQEGTRGTPHHASLGPHSGHPARGQHKPGRWSRSVRGRGHSSG